MQQTTSNNTDAPAPGHPDTPDSIGISKAPVAVLAIGTFAISTEMFLLAGLLAPLAAELGVTLGVGGMAGTWWGGAAADRRGGARVVLTGVDFLWILAVACGTAGMIMHVVTHVLSREPRS